MKKYWFVCLLAIFCLLPLSAQIPQWGSFYVELIGTDGVVDVDIYGNQWVFDVGYGFKSTVNVTVDNNRKTIKIPMFNGYADDFVYNETYGYIDFYRGDTFNLNIYDLMSEPLTQLKNVYGVSTDFTNILLEDLQKSFTRAPILRLRSR